MTNSAIAVDASREEKRLRILRAARRVCREAGFAGARMDAVAACAQVSKGTLYHFYPSKEALFEAALLENHDSALEACRAALGGAAPPPARLERLVDDLARQLPEISSEMPVNMQIWGVVAGDEAARHRVSRALSRVYAEMRGVIAETVEEGIADGSVAADVDVAAFVAACVAVVDGFIYRSTFDAIDPSDLRASMHILIRERLRPASGEKHR